MIIILFFLSLAWTIRILSNVLSYVHLWYIKEYRLDRLLIHLGTPQGKRLLFIQSKRPPVSPKTIFLVTVSIIILAEAQLGLPFSFFINLLIIDLLTFPTVSFLVFILKIPTLLYHEWLIYLAVRRLRAHKKLLVIGVTGSYGKTSTKEYLTTILSRQFKVLKTEASKNSPIGIAEIVLKSLSNDHQIFIVEMGAYKTGEIAKMCTIVRPQVGIITAINAQHQDLFKSIKTTMKAKFELIQGLTGKQIAIINADNKYTREMVRWSMAEKKNVWTYSKDGRIVSGVQQRFFGRSIVSSSTGLNFIADHNKDSQKVEVSVLGQHQVSNILAAIAGSIAVGMSIKDAALACQDIRPFDKTLEYIPGINGSTFINDTFNNNPDAAKAAIDVLSKGTGRKILVFQPMIELGSYAKNSHEEVGRYASRVCHEIILTNNNFYSWFQKGAKRSASQASVSVLSPKEAARHLSQIVGPDDTVLFKGKESEQVLNLLVKT